MKREGGREGGEEKMGGQEGGGWREQYGAIQGKAYHLCCREGV